MQKRAGKIGVIAAICRRCRGGGRAKQMGAELHTHGREGGRADQRGDVFVGYARGVP